MTVPVLDKHIDITPGIVGGKPRIKGHRTTVQNIAIWHERMGISVDEISAEYGLSLAEIYAALSYYFDHQDEINEIIREGEASVEEMREQNDSALTQKDQAKIKRIIDHCETQSEDEAVSEDEAALANEETLVQVPLELVAEVRVLIAKQKGKH